MCEPVTSSELAPSWCAVRENLSTIPSEGSSTLARSEIGGVTCVPLRDAARVAERGGLSGMQDRNGGHCLGRKVDGYGLRPCNRNLRHRIVIIGLCALVFGVSGSLASAQDGRRWLAGDHHIHTHFSVGYDTATVPPTPILGGGGAPYSIPMNANMARKFGLSWMVITDHGGPNHSKVSLEWAYPELLQSRAAVPDLIQFHGMEFDSPAAGHSSLIIPHSDHEHHMLHDLESRFSRRDVFPSDPERNTEEFMLEALTYMKDLPLPPVLIANHPSRGASAIGVYGDKEPRELRGWNDTAPDVAVGMEGIPGHQAATLNPEGYHKRRGGYHGYPTMGGFDQMAARLGGFWDSMLGEGRRWWITATSDSHIHWRDGGSDFWPGEYSKTYVYAEKEYEDILDGLRNGRVFVTTGDLVTELYVTAETRGAERVRADIGGTLQVPASDNVQVTIRMREPEQPNPNGDNPRVARVDLIVGGITGLVADRTADTNPTTRVVQRFTAGDWKRDGAYIVMEYTLTNVHHASYLRVRGTNGFEMEPEPDPAGEDPWSDLWFYSNPIFLEVH
jgi:hypothetical protein